MKPDAEPNVIAEAENIGNNILMQGNLCPFTYIDQPIYWEYGEALNITPNPDILILADLCTFYTVN